ncbi:hypothetical protein ACTXT7_011093 [Hymenolepis weldensis]
MYACESLTHALESCFRVNISAATSVTTTTSTSTAAQPRYFIRTAAESVPKCGRGGAARDGAETRIGRR